MLNRVNPIPFPSGRRPFSDPPFFFTREQATWECPVCGIVEATWHKRIERWMRHTCACQAEAKRLQQEKQLREEQIAALCSQTYGWLGPTWRASGMESKTFETFDRSQQPDGYESAEMFCDLMEGSLVLHGPFGTGKTHLLAAVCNSLRVKYLQKSLFTTAPKLFGALQECISYASDMNKIINQASSTPLLVIDDVDKAKPSEWREERYFDIINSRVDRGLPTAISTNRLDELGTFVGEAVASRLKIGQIRVKMIGNDYRENLR